MNEYDVWDVDLFNVFDVVLFHQDLDNLRFDFVPLLDGLNQNVIPSLYPNVLTKFCRHRDLENDRIVERLWIQLFCFYFTFYTLHYSIIIDHFWALTKVLKGLGLNHILSTCLPLSDHLFDFLGYC